MRTATLLISCADQKGLVAQLAQFVHGHGGNILHSDHHNDAEKGLFLSRIEWDLEDFDLADEAIAAAFEPLAESWDAQWELHWSDAVPRVSIWVSKQEHCLLDLIWRRKTGDLRAEIALVVSNHEKLRPIAEDHGIEFRRFEVTRATKRIREKEELALLRERRIDLVILAKYMQILSPALLKEFPRIINIHHSFLPAFPGAHPYRQAHERGVKIIGATAHYATSDLDEGPIIDQDVAHISHRDSVADLVRKGKDLERNVLARAVRLHLENRVLVYRNKTVVFD